MLITAAPQSSSYNAATTEASASSQNSETLSQKEKEKQEKADKKLKQLIRDNLPKPKRNTTARTPDPKQRGKEKSVQNTDRPPKGSDDPIRQHNRFSSLEDMMEAEESPSCIPKGTWEWSGGAMVLGKLPVPGRPTIWITVGQGPTAHTVGADGGCLDIFTLLYPFSSFSLSLGVGPI